MNPFQQRKNLHWLIIFLLAYLIITCVTGLVSAQTLLDKRIDLGRNEAAYGVIQTQDGGYLLVGSIDQTGSSLQDVLVVKTNAQGDTVWTNTIRMPQSEVATAAIQTVDGGYYIGANVQVNNPPIPIHSDWLLIRLNADGDTLWTRTNGFSKNDRLFKLIRDGNAGVIAVGYRDIAGYGIGAYSRYSPNGQLTQNSNFTGFTAIVQDGFLDDVGQLTLLGSNFSQTHDFALYQFSSGMPNLFIKRFAVPVTGEFPSRVSRLNNGSYIISGVTGFNQNYKPMLMRVNPNFDTVWTRRYNQFSTPTFGQEYGAQSVVNNQNQIFVAFTDFEDQNDPEGRLLVVSQLGDLNKSFLFGHPGNNSVEDLIVNADQNPVVCGIAPQVSGFGSDMWLSIPNPNFITGLEEKQTSNKMWIFPNPVSSTLVLEDVNAKEEFVELELFDLQGKRLFAETLHFENGKAELDLSSRNLPKAMYPIRIQTPGGIEWKRVMKE